MVAGVMWSVPVTVPHIGLQLGLAAGQDLAGALGR